LDSISTTFSRKLDVSYSPIPSFQVTSFEDSKWPQEYYLGAVYVYCQWYFRFNAIGNYAPTDNASRAIDAITPIHLPSSMTMAFELYAAEFLRDYPERKLKLIPHFGYGEVLQFIVVDLLVYWFFLACSRFFCVQQLLIYEILYRINEDKKVTLIATTLQIIVLETLGCMISMPLIYYLYLLLAEELSFVDIQEHCRILVPDLVSTLLSLLAVRRNCQNALLLRKPFNAESMCCYNLI
jgi:hypothetical protein